MEFRFSAPAVKLLSWQQHEEYIAICFNLQFFPTGASKCSVTVLNNYFYISLNLVATFLCLNLANILKRTSCVNSSRSSPRHSKGFWFYNPITPQRQKSPAILNVSLQCFVKPPTRSIFEGNWCWWRHLILIPVSILSLLTSCICT